MNAIRWGVLGTRIMDLRADAEKLPPEARKKVEKAIALLTRAQHDLSKRN